jgi:hypothetical protein
VWKSKLPQVIEPKTTVPERTWERAGWEAAQSSRLPAPTVAIFISEMQLDARTGAAYGIGSDLGRIAASGVLVTDLHPGNFLLNAEQFIISDPGKLLRVEVKAAALLGWLADMRATWGDAFIGIGAGFVQGIRAATATSHPELGREQEPTAKSNAWAFLDRPKTA